MRDEMLCPRRCRHVVVALIHVCTRHVCYRISRFGVPNNQDADAMEPCKFQSFVCTTRCNPAGSATCKLHKAINNPQRSYHTHIPAGAGIAGLTDQGKQTIIASCVYLAAPSWGKLQRRSGRYDALQGGSRAVMPGRWPTMGIEGPCQGQVPSLAWFIVSFLQAAAHGPVLRRQRLY